MRIQITCEHKACLLLKAKPLSSGQIPRLYLTVVSGTPSFGKVITNEAHAKVSILTEAFSVR